MDIAKGKIPNMRTIAPRLTHLTITRMGDPIQIQMLQDRYNYLYVLVFIRVYILHVHVFGYTSNNINIGLLMISCTKLFKESWH